MSPELRSLYRCLACTEPWMGSRTPEGQEMPKRCPHCVTAGREIPAWVQAWHRSRATQRALGLLAPFRAIDEKAKKYDSLPSAGKTEDWWP